MQRNSASGRERTTSVPDVPPVKKFTREVYPSYRRGLTRGAHQRATLVL